MKKSLLVFFAAVLIVSGASRVFAAEQQPLEITAEKTLEWHRNDRKYIAEGKAVAKQGDVMIAAETLTALYNETKASSFDIFRLSASGGVTIIAQGSAATGEEAAYDIDTGVAVMTGKNLKMTSPDQIVTARDKFEYHAKEGRLSAFGEAVAVRGTDSLRADKISAWFAPGQNDKQRRLTKLVAEGRVVIRTPDETLTGARAQYEASTDVAELTGGVKITRGQNILEGEKAEVNLATNVSRMTGGGSDGRVHGIFYPGTDGDNPVQDVMTAPVR